MKNFLTLLLLVISLLVSGQSNSQSLEVEIKYWKSIAESNDTVAYREYLQRYGEDGLYKDEALTRIALLKTSGKQVQSKTLECCYYYGENGRSYGWFVVRFNGNQNTIWLKSAGADSYTIRANLAVSRDFYEHQAVIPLSRGTQEYKDAIKNDKKAIEEAEYARIYEKNRRKKSEIIQKAEQSRSPEDYQNAWTADEEYKYDPMKSTSARDVYFKRYELHEIERSLYEFDQQRGIWNYGRRNYDTTFYVYSDDYFNDEFYNGKDYLVYMKGKGHYEIKKTIKGYRYIAFTKDKSSFIMWFEKDDNLDGVIYEKRYYYRKPKEKLLPKAVNYDFLNR